MPGRDKPLIARNGIPDPQAYNPQTGQWESFIGVSWGKTAGGLYVPIRVDDQGRQEVTLSGNIVEALTVFNGLALTGTDSIMSDVIEINRFKNLRFYALNTHDSDLRVGVHLQPGMNVSPNAMSVYFEGEWKTTYRAASVIQITDKIGSVIDLGSLYTFLNSIKGYSVRLYVTPLSAPTKGAVSMWIVGEVR